MIIYTHQRKAKQIQEDNEMEKSFEMLVDSFRNELHRYEKEYHKYEKEFAREYNTAHKDKVIDAAASYINGVANAVMYAYGTEEAKIIKEIAEDDFEEIYKGQTIVGTVLAFV
jgi:sugar-specific transcriptional regulator TrmB